MAGFPHYLVSVYRCMCVCVWLSWCVNHRFLTRLRGDEKKIFLFWLKLVSNGIKLCKRDLIGALKLQYNRWRVDLRTNRAATWCNKSLAGFAAKHTHMHTRELFLLTGPQKSFMTTPFNEARQVMEENDGTHGMDKDQRNYSASRCNVHRVICHN